MKPIFLTSLLFLFAISFATAQEKPSPEAEAFFKKAMATINPRHVAWVNSTAKTANEKNMTDAEVQTMASKYGVLGNMATGDIEAMAFLVMMQASKSAQEDLKAIMNGVKAINEQKKEQRELLAKMQRQQSMTSMQLDSFKLSRSKTIAIQKKQNPAAVKLVRSGTLRKSPTKTEIDAMTDQIKNDLDSMSEMGEMESLRLQMSMDRLSKMMSTLSNILKKISDTANQITQNLK